MKDEVTRLWCKPALLTILSDLTTELSLTYLNVQFKVHIFYSELTTLQKVGVGQGLHVAISLTFLHMRACLNWPNKHNNVNNLSYSVYLIVFIQKQHEH